MIAATYVPELDSLADGFPESMPPPELLRDFARWLGTQPRSSLGWFHVVSERIDAAYVHDDLAAERLREWLGAFMVLPQGARLALWRQPDNAARRNGSGRIKPAVVLLHADGSVRNVAPDLETFLLALAREQTGVSELDRAGADSARARSSLSGWLAAKGIRERSTPGSAPDFAGWFEAFVREARAAVDPRSSQRARPLMAADDISAGASRRQELPADLFERAASLLGRTTEDPSLIGFFEGLGVDLRAYRDPRQLRSLAWPNEGVSFEIAWPWDYASQWLTTEYPRPARKELERQRARMFWGISLYAVPERVASVQFEPYGGALPFGISADVSPHELEARLGPPTHGSVAGYTWDDAVRRRSLYVAWNDGRALRPELPRGVLCSVRYRYSLAFDV